MALPPQRLLNDDLFVINRIETPDVNTFKVNANDIGIFLLEAPRPPGSSPDDKFVNDGPLNVYGEIPGTSSEYINLHSANEYCEGKLNFREGFYVTGADMDVTIHHDYAEIANNLACLNGGIDGSTTCLKLDMVWLSENIICSGSGLDTAGDCIFIDLCPHSGLVIDSSGCLEVSLCPGRGIIHDPLDGCLDVDLNYLSQVLSCEGLQPQGGNPDATCIELDMVWLSANIRCGEATDNSAENGSGLIDEMGCIRVDPCWVSDQWNVDNPNPPDDVQSIDIEQCKLAINHDWLLQWAKDNLNDIVIAPSSSDCLSVEGNANVAKGEVKLKLKEQCLKDLIDSRIPDQCDGKLTIVQSTGNETYDPCSGDKTITIAGSGAGGANDGKLKLKAGTNVTITKKSGSTNNFSANTDEDYEFEISATSTPPCTGAGIIVDSKGCFAVDEDDDACLKMGRIWASTATFRLAGTNNRPGITLGAGSTTAKNQPYLGITGSEVAGRFRVTWDNTWDGSTGCGGNPIGGSKDLFYIDRDQNNSNADVRFKISCMAEKPGGKANMRWAGSNIGGPSTSGSGTVFWVATTRSATNSIVRTADDDANVASFNSDTILDQIAGPGDAGVLNGGLIKFYVDSKSAAGTVQGEIKHWPDYATPTVFLEDIAALHPSLVHWTWSDDSYEEYEPYPGTGYGVNQRLKPNPTAVPDEVNFDALTLLSIAGVRRLKKRVEELEAKTTLQGTLNTLGIVEYTNETAAANSGLGQGEVYWDTSLNRMRSVT